MKTNQLSIKKFDKGKQILDNLLSTSISFQNEGLGYISKGKQKMQQANKKTTFVASSSSPPKTLTYNTPKKRPSTFVNPRNMHAENRYTYKNVHVSYKQHPFTTHKTCYFCGKSGHLIANCIARKNSLKTRTVWIPKHLIHNATNIGGPKGTWVPKVTR